VAAGEVGKDEAVGGGLLFFRIGHVVCCLESKVRWLCVSQHSFFVKYFYSKEHPGSLVLTKHKNLHVCRLFIFRLQLITILVGM
jgi:hypothetical protein